MGLFRTDGVSTKKLKADADKAKRNLETTKESIQKTNEFLGLSQELLRTVGTNPKRAEHAIDGLKKLIAETWGIP